MTTVIKTNQILVHSPLESTFEYVSDLSRHSEWNDGLNIEAVEPGPIVVGKESKITAVPDLRNKIMAVPGYAQVQDVLLRKALVAANVDAQAVTIIQCH